MVPLIFTVNTTGLNAEMNNMRVLHVDELALSL